MLRAVDAVLAPPQYLGRYVRGYFCKTHTFSCFRRRRLLRRARRAFPTGTKVDLKWMGSNGYMI
jgi:hypothetical protein